MNSRTVASARWSITRLLLASFLTLFAELAFIRWIAVEFSRIHLFQKSGAVALLRGIRPRMRFGAQAGALAGGRYGIVRVAAGHPVAVAERKSSGGTVPESGRGR